MNKEFFKEIFQKRKLRLSHPRLFIYQELSSSKSPLSPIELYRNLKKKHNKVGLTSIYRTLDLFESLGVAHKISNGAVVRYKSCELDHHHHHIICQSCGRVVEFEICDISEWSKKVAESTGYQVIDHQINFFGLCKACSISKP